MDMGGGVNAKTGHPAKAALWIFNTLRIAVCVHFQHMAAIADITSLE